MALEIDHATGLEREELLGEVERQATLRAGPTSGTVWNSGTSCFSWPFTFSSGRRCNVFVQLWPFGTLLQVMSLRACTCWP